MRLLPLLIATLHHGISRKGVGAFSISRPPFQRFKNKNKRANIVASCLFSTAPTSGIGDSTPTSPKHAHRILCYGDSLTAGTTTSVYDLFPYAPHLEAALNNGVNTADTSTFMVRHRGMPGWTASAMIDAADDGQYGLRSACKKIQNPPLQLVIILAGTNDLGYEISQPDAASTIMTNLVALHEQAWEVGVPQTMALGIPSSGYQAQVAEAAALALNVNQKLSDFCQASDGKAVFVDFPFDFEMVGFHNEDDDENDSNWSSDGLHFSPKGYRVLGEYLKDPVLKALAK